MLKVPSLERLVHELNQLPGIGPKTAQRLAYSIIKRRGYSQDLREALQQVEERVHLCSQCFTYTDEVEVCQFCSDPNRRNDIICIVEEPSGIGRVESSGAFRGIYHVLHGSLSPLEGVSPSDLKIKELMVRIDQQEREGTPVQEIILALDPDLEGDTTVLYLAQLLQEKNLRVTRIAHGVPMGSDIDFIDDRTLGRALDNRVEI